MAYSTPHTFYVDYINGSDETRAPLSNVVFSNPSGTTVRGTYAGHGLVNGAIITVSGCTQGYANDQWEIENVAENTFDLVGALWASFNGADVTGNVVPFGGSSWADAWLTCYAGGTAAKIKPGVTFKVAKSAAPFSLGKTGIWNSPTSAGGMPAAKAISSSTNATPIQINCNAHGLVNGDLVYVYSHQTNVAANGCWAVTKVNDNAFTLDNSVGTAAGSSGYFQKANTRIVELASAETQLLDDGDVAWAASGSSTCSVVTSSAPTGYAGAKVAKTSPANSTLYAYKTLTEVNLSAYQAICLWLQTTVAIASVDNISICLCSDTSGATVVDTFKVPVIKYPTSKYIPLTLTKSGGGNLGASIKSIAIYSGSSAPASISLLWDNINACKSSGLALPHLISKNTAEQGGNEGWWPIKALYGKYVLLDATRGYFGTTETATTYAREARCPFSAMPSGATTTLDGIVEAGTAESTNTISGGWDTTSGLQDGETFLDALAQHGVFGLQAYSNVDHMSFVRLYALYGANGTNYTNTQTVASVYSGFNLTSGAVNLGTVKNIIGCNYGIQGTGGITSLSWTELTNVLSNDASGLYQLPAAGTRTLVTNLCNNGGQGLQVADPYNGDIETITHADYNQTYGVYFYGARNARFKSIGTADYNGTAGLHFAPNSSIICSHIDIGSIQCKNNGSFGISATCNVEESNIGTLTTEGNGTSAFRWSNGKLNIHQGTISEATIVTWFTTAGVPDNRSCIGISQLGSTAGRFYREHYRGIITDPTTAGESEAWSSGGSGNCLYINPNSATAPVTIDFFIPCTASQGIQAKFKVRTSVGDPDPNPTMKFYAMGSGITPIWGAPVTLTESWAEYTSDTMTPTLTGFVHCKLEIYDGSTSGDVGIDDIQYAAAA